MRESRERERELARQQAPSQNSQRAPRSSPSFSTKPDFAQNIPHPELCACIRKAREELRNGRPAGTRPIQGASDALHSPDPNSEQEHNAGERNDADGDFNQGMSSGGDVFMCEQRATVI